MRTFTGWLVLGGMMCAGMLAACTSLVHLMGLSTD